MNQIFLYTESPTDYVSVEEVLTFAACESQRCVNVRLANDLVSEPEETFSLSLTQSTSSHISFTSAIGVVVITDDDGTFGLPFAVFTITSFFPSSLISPLAILSLS